MYTSREIQHVENALAVADNMRLHATGRTLNKIFPSWSAQPMTALEALALSTENNPTLRYLKKAQQFIANIDSDIQLAASRGQTAIHPVIKDNGFRYIVPKIQDHYENIGYVVTVPNVSRSATYVIIAIDWSAPK